jgi:hypothetical protein
VGYWRTNTHSSATVSYSILKMLTLLKLSNINVFRMAGVFVLKPVILSGLQDICFNMTHS